MSRSSHPSYTNPLNPGSPETSERMALSACRQAVAAAARRLRAAQRNVDAEPRNADRRSVLARVKAEHADAVRRLSEVQS